VNRLRARNLAVKSLAAVINTDNVSGWKRISTRQNDATQTTK